MSEGGRKEGGRREEGRRRKRRKEGGWERWEEKVVGSMEEEGEKAVRGKGRGRKG